MMGAMSRLPQIERGPLAMLVIGGAALGLYLLLLAVSFLDPAFAGSRVGRNIAVAGVDVSGTPATEVVSRLEPLADEHAGAAVVVDAGHGAISARAADLGLSLDLVASAGEVRRANETALLSRPFRWVASFFTTREVSPVWSVDEPTLHSALLDLDLPGVTEWRLPDFDADADGVRVVPGVTGSGIDADDFSRRLLHAAESDQRPILVVPTLVDVVPPVSDEAVEAAAAAAEAATSAPLEVTVGDVTREIDVATLRSWLALVIDDTDADWDVDHELVTEDIASRFDDAESPGADVAFVVEGGQLNLIPGADRTSCCEDGSSERVAQALRRGLGRVTLELVSEETVRGSEWAESLGIVEEVASFTTRHPCCQNRVVNIHLIADAVRGVVIEPGQTFSMNEHVGRRTAEKGYLPAGGITNGVMVDQLGGGVSQFTTTLFNAAFFAGLDFGEYQAHSIYFSRYPYGREATLSHPHPDLQIRNTTPYGVLLWPTYTDTSITVTLYSTKHVTAEQTGQTTSPQGACTRVRTERTRTYDDGRQVVDSVGALYRPREGVNCSGESTIPTTVPEDEGEEPPPNGENTTSTTTPATTTSTTAPPPPPSEPPPDVPPPEGG
jgi:vancomycin resistance protein YoaR